MLIRIWSLAWLFAWSSVGLAGCSHDGNGGSVSIRQLTTHLNESNPDSELVTALRRGDRRFTGLNLSVVAVPGIIGGSGNSIVILHGIKTIKGTTDSPNSSGLEALNAAAREYALRYNVALLKSLLAKPDGKTRILLKGVRKELLTLERSDATLDSQRDASKKKARFIMVVGEGILGVPDDGTDLVVQRAGTRLLLSNASILDGSQLRQFKSVLKHYVTVYNKNLYRILTKK